MEASSRTDREMDRRMRLGRRRGKWDLRDGFLVKTPRILLPERGAGERSETEGLLSRTSP